MTYDETDSTPLETADGRVSAMREAALVRFGCEAKAKSFLNTSFRDAGGKTPLQMAQGSLSGYETAKCLMRELRGA